MKKIKTQAKKALINDKGFLYFGAGKETRTLDPNLGKVMLYQLSYSRFMVCIIENFIKLSTLYVFNWRINQHDAKLFLGEYLLKQCLDLTTIDEFHQLLQILWLFSHQHVAE